MKEKSIVAIGNFCLFLMIRELKKYTSRDSITINKNIWGMTACMDKFAFLFIDDISAQDVYDYIPQLNIIGTFDDQQIIDVWFEFCIATADELKRPRIYGKDILVDKVPITAKDFLNLGYREGYITPAPNRLALLTSSLEDIHTIKTQGD